MKPKAKVITGHNAQQEAVDLLNQMRRVRVTPTKILVDGKVVRFDKPPGGVSRHAITIKNRGQWRPINKAHQRLAEAADMLLTRMKERVEFNHRMEAVDAKCAS